jgi:hypothetical protein
MQRCELPTSHRLRSHVAKYRRITHTRLASSGQFPGQLAEDTFVSQMAKMWNGLPEEIKTVTI